MSENGAPPDRAAVDSFDQRLARLRHDLRTPLSVIIGFATVLQEDLEDPEQKQDATEILTNARKLLAMVDDLAADPVDRGRSAP